jgi:hypothetical protein
MRKRDVLRQLRKLQDSPRGCPSHCRMCKKVPTFVLYNERERGKQTFVCNLHIGQTIAWWTTAHQINVVRL